MDKILQGYEQLIQNFVQWAQTQDDIRLAFVLGSRARTDHPADEWSDLDLAVVTKDIRPYIDQADWIKHIGKPRLTFIEKTPDGVSVERRVLFDGELDVDFAMMPLEMIQAMAEKGMNPDTADVFRRGVRVVLDKDNLLPDPDKYASAWKPPEPPSEAEFLQAVNDFWYHALWTAKHLRRGELWWGKDVAMGNLSIYCGRSWNGTRVPPRGGVMTPGCAAASWKSGLTRGRSGNYQAPSPITMKRIFGAPSM
jgi:aminoglycoside 6-adenylyltransferase